MNYLKSVAALAIVLLCQSCALFDTPQSTVERFYRSAAAGNFEEAEGLLAARVLTLGKDKLKAALTELQTKIEKSGGIASITFTDVNVNGDKCKLVAVLALGNGTSERETDQLIKEERRWKIDINK